MRKRRRYSAGAAAQARNGSIFFSHYRYEEKGAESTAKVYQSRVLQILSEDTLEISMPMEQTRLILLPVDSEYDMIFFEENSLYQCFARIIDRYKSNNVYVLVMELTSNLRKYQRREYYRFSCALVIIW